MTGRSRYLRDCEITLEKEGHHLCLTPVRYSCCSCTKFLGWTQCPPLWAYSAAGYTDGENLTWVSCFALLCTQRRAGRCLWSCRVRGEARITHLQTLQEDSARLLICWSTVYSACTGLTRNGLDCGSWYYGGGADKIRLGRCAGRAGQCTTTPVILSCPAPAACSPRPVASGPAQPAANLPASQPASQSTTQLHPARRS